MTPSETPLTDAQPRSYGNVDFYFAQDMEKVLNQAMEALGTCWHKAVGGINKGRPIAYQFNLEKVEKALAAYETLKRKYKV